jgi:hypothetical protein
MARCFFFNMPEGTMVLRRTYRLSPNMSAALSNGIPSILNLYHTSMMSSDTIHPATISDPYVAISMVFWRFEIHLMGVQLMSRTIQVTDLWVNLSVA